MKNLAAKIIWFLVAIAGAWAYVTLALHRGEPVNSAYILIAALCTYAIGYRFYSKWIAARVLMLERPPRHAVRGARRRQGFRARRTNGLSSGIISRRSPGRGRWWGRCWRRNSVICRARCGF